MAYSNINRDKEQAGWANLVKNSGLAGFMLVIMYSSVSNIWRQWLTVRNAQSRNAVLKTEIETIKARNRILEKQIEYATSSAYINQKTREYLGLGGPNDYWLKLPKDTGSLNFGSEFNEVTEVPIIWQWWSLFFPKP